MLPFGGAECRALCEQEFRPQGEFRVSVRVHPPVFVRARVVCVRVCAHAPAPARAQPRRTRSTMIGTD
jgi:hypothetical protein